MTKCNTVNFLEILKQTSGWITEKLKWEIRNYLKLNDIENIMYQNLWDAFLLHFPSWPIQF